MPNDHALTRRPVRPMLEPKRKLRVVDPAPASSRRPSPTSLHADDGARAERVDGGVDFFDPEGRLLVRYRAGGVLEIASAHGDLVLGSATGQVRVEAATDFVVAASRDVHLQAERRVDLDVGGRKEASPSSESSTSLQATRFSLQRRATVLATPSLDVRAGVSRLTTGDATIVARHLQTAATRIVTTAEDLEVTAGRVVERAREVLQEVTGVLQSRLGRVQSLVLGDYTLGTKRTELTSEEDTAIDGRRVLLG